MMMMMTTFAWPPDDDDDDDDKIHARCKQRQPEEHAHKTLIDLYVCMGAVAPETIKMGGT